MATWMAAFAAMTVMERMPPSWLRALDAAGDAHAVGGFEPEVAGIVAVGAGTELGLDHQIGAAVVLLEEEAELQLAAVIPELREGTLVQRQATALARHFLMMDVERATERAGDGGLATARPDLASSFSSTLLSEMPQYISPC
jgi:hypothetical protein